MNAEQFMRVSKALSDPQRLAILERIAGAAGAAGRPGRELACRELVRNAAVVPATVSHHLKELQVAGLVRGRKQGQCMYLSFVREVMSEYQRELGRRLGGSPPRRRAGAGSGGSKRR